MSHFSIGLEYQATASVSYAEVNSNTSSLLTYTYTAQAIGVATDSRVVIVGTGTRGAGQLAAAVTIAGISATKLIATADPSVLNAAELWAAAVPAAKGTTGDIVVTYSVAPPRNALVVWCAYNLLNRGTTTQTGSSSAASPSVALAPPTHGIAVAFLYGGAAVTVTWAGLTEDVDTQVASQNFSGASGVYQSATSPATATPSGSMTNPIMVMATLR
jgi:hypothetical protein